MALLDIPLVSTALALIISWALFAILCSLLNEALAQIKAERGRFMRNYLFKQLQDLPNGVNWASILYLNGSINLLSREAEKPTNEISPRVFAEALINAVGSTHLVQTHKMTAAGEKAATAGEAGSAMYKNPVLADFKLATQVLNHSDMVSFFSQALASAELKAGDQPNVESAVYSNLLATIQAWFEDFTGRLTLWYKKKTRLRLFMLGCLLGLIINVDSIQLFSFFNAYPQAREAYISFYKENEADLANIADQLDSLAATPPANQLPELKTTVNQLTPVVKTADSLRQAYNLPVGLSYSVFCQSVPLQPLPIIYKLLGILLTGFAASFGAPFWFEILRKAYSK